MRPGRLPAIPTGTMPTPTSPELPPKQPELTPADAIEALRRGHVSAAALRALSDLSRAEAASVAVAWPTLPDATRLEAMRVVGELSESDVHLAFGRLLRIALED